MNVDPEKLEISEDTVEALYNVYRSMGGGTSDFLDFAEDFGEGSYNDPWEDAELNRIAQFISAHIILATSVNFEV